MEVLFARIYQLAVDCAAAGAPDLGAALARLGAIAAMGRAQEAHDLLLPLAEAACGDALLSLSAGPGAAGRPQ